MTKWPVTTLLFSYLLTSCSFNMPKEVEVEYEKLPEVVDFNFHVKPILSDRCYNCHGPDENTRKAGLRLDLEESAFEKLVSGNHAFVAKKPHKSEVVQRLLTDNEALVMPPPEAKLIVTDREKAIIIKWIEQGAQWKEHWAFDKPREQTPPKIKNKEWATTNAIDRFVQKKLEQKGWTPSAEAKKERLLRRVTMDLTGLPPTIDEMDAFLADDDPNAYEKVVDRLLASDAYAERLTLDWMDLSRYADSHGLHADGSRMMWPWRDWVINAFKENMPYDQFVTWQLAGDLLPNATRQQQLATAFNRNHPMMSEGGAIDEEFRLSYVFDRTETVGTAFLGLTIACAKCHDHKFDPISQKDYFQMTAFFNNVREVGMTSDDGNQGPVMALPDAQTEKKLALLQEDIIKKEKQIELTKKELLDLKTYMDRLPDQKDTQKGQLAHYTFDAVRKRKSTDGKAGFNTIWAGRATNKNIVDGNPKASVDRIPKIVEGVKGSALEMQGDYDHIVLNDIPNFEWTDSFSASVWANTYQREVGKSQQLIGNSGNKNTLWRGWEFYLDSLNRVNVKLIHSVPHNLLHVRSKDSIKTKEWNHLAFSYDGSGKANGLKVYINGVPSTVEIPYDRLYKSIKPISARKLEPLYLPTFVGRSYREFTGEYGIFKGALDEIRIYERPLGPLDIANLYDGIKQTNLLAEKVGEKPELAKNHWIQFDAKVVAQTKELAQLRNTWLNQIIPVPEIMVMEDMPTKRTAYIYNRGEYDQPTDSVQMNTPEVLPPFLDEYPKNRLGLAQWLFNKENPLTARVTVNRYWQLLFGKGLVTTPQDFGIQGALPTHPELLDWLALDFMENNWDVKALLKTMVLSHTYRQSSIITEKMQLEDPTNVFLARSNSFRLPAEMIRDNALAASGLLVKKVGGESVKPYQPPNLWIEKSNFSYDLLTYKKSSGDSLYRRGLYTFVRRTSPHPAMTAFDAPSREVCTVKREKTNTPMQALVLLNDTQFVEASRILAERIQKEGGKTLGSQIAYAFRLATGRRPKDSELDILKKLYESQKEHFERNPKDAINILSVGEKKFDDALDTCTTAALAVVSNTIFNHDDASIRR